MRLFASVVAVAVTACGRIGFEVRAQDASVADTPLVVDAEEPTSIRFPMDDDPTTSGQVTAIPSSRSVTCGPCPAHTTDHIVGAGAYAFDGTLRVILGDVLPQTGPYTVTVWLNGVPSATFGSAISKPLDLVTVNDDLSLTISTGGWSFEGTRGGSVASAADMTEVRGAWHHFALLDDRVNRTIYLDGQLKSTAPGPWETSTLPIAIGADLDQGSFSVPFTGTMDDLRFYPRVLDASEIAAVYAERL